MGTKHIHVTGTRIVPIIAPPSIIAPPLAKTRKKKFINPKNPQKIFFCFFWGPHKFVENRQIYRKDFKIYKKSMICYEI